MERSFALEALALAAAEGGPREPARADRSEQRDGKRFAERRNHQLQEVIEWNGYATTGRGLCWPGRFCWGCSPVR